MNPEILIAQAGIAIAWFLRHNDATCYLCYEDDDVHAYPIKKASIKPSPCLVITTYQQEIGLTSSRWQAIGSALLAQFNMETSK